MLNVLIVDDEPYIRQGLSMLIDWQAEGFNIISEASDGVEALKVMECTHVDLIIADIQMPQMDGITLLREIRSRGMDDVQFIILSGFREFGYAREAMKYGCIDYMVKPVNRDELLRLLRGIAAKFEEQCRAEEEEEERSSAMLEKNLLPLLLGRFDEINLNYVREHLTLSDKMRYINVELDVSDPKLADKSAEQLRVMQRSLYNNLKNTLGKWKNHVIINSVKLENSYDAGLIYIREMTDELMMKEQDFFNWLKERANYGIDCRIVMQVGGVVNSLEQLHESYRSASIAKFMQDFQDNGGLCVVDDDNQNEVPIGVYSEIKKYLDDVVNTVERGSNAEIEKAVDALYRCMTDLCLDYRVMSMNLSHILFRLVHLAVERDGTGNIDQQESVNYIIENAFDKGVVRGSAAHFAKFCCEYADYLRQIESQSAGNTLTMVEREISEKYMTNISLKQLGETFYINSAYLGQLFKKKYGMAFKDYLNSVRINKSVELLAQTDMKVYEISAAVGYQSVDYFIAKFVDQMGHTPAKYRKTVRGQKNDENEE